MPSKEENIQEAIRLVQVCNFSRRKAASSTGISPNTLKRRLNGSIPREEYLERTKKITASEELILENMIIALIQQGDHIKASALRSLVALYIQNKTAPTKLEDCKNEDIELIPKGWCTRFMKRSKNLTVSQGFIEIKDKQRALPNQENVLPAFAVFMKPASPKESLADTQEEIVNNASTLIEGFRKDFLYSASKCQDLVKQGNGSELKASVAQLQTIFDDVTTLASVLNFTSHVTQHNSCHAPTLSANSIANLSEDFSRTKKVLITPDHSPQLQHISQPVKIEIAGDDGFNFYNSTTSISPTSPLTPTTPNSYQQQQQPLNNKRRASVADGMLPPNSHARQPSSKKQRLTGRSASLSGDYQFCNNNSIVPVSQWQPEPVATFTTMPFTTLGATATDTATTTSAAPDYFSHQPTAGSIVPVTSAPDFDLLLQSDHEATAFSSVEMMPAITSTSDEVFGYGGDYGLPSTFDNIPMLETTAGVPVTMADFGIMGGF